MYTVNLTSDPVKLTRQLIDIPSPSHEEKDIADAIYNALSSIDGIELERHNNTVMARTNRGLPTRAVLAGHIDTVPIADNVPSRTENDIIYGCGAVDMKSGLACYLHAFATLANSPQLTRDMTMIAYECEEIAARYNGLGHIDQEWLHGDVALLGEPSGGIIEAGCQGSIRVKVIAHGTRAHSARAWLGDNAIHKLTPVLTRVANYAPRDVLIDGCEYKEGLNVVHLEAGVATNTIPDEAWAFINFRFAPDRTIDEAMDHLLSVLDLPEGIDLEVDDASLAAAPGLSRPAAAELVEALGGQFRAKYGWTDVARFSNLGIPAVNLGSGDPGFAHKPDEQCPISQITQVSDALTSYLTR